MSGLSDGFISTLLVSFLTNIWVAGASLLLGLAIGAPLAWLRHRSRWFGRPAAALTALLRAAPTFVVMFFLLNVMPPDISILGFSILIPGVAILVLALAIYAAAYVSDNLLDTLRHLHRGSISGALLFVPNMLRAFFVLVMASSVGAAIGVREAVNTTLHETDHLLTIGNRIELVLGVILVFASFMQLAQFGVRQLTRYLSERNLRSERAAAATSAQAEAPDLIARDA